MAKETMEKEMTGRHVSKEGLISVVNDLNGIIRNINYRNCYDMVVKFFGLTGVLDDYLSEIKDFPLKGTKILGIKSHARKLAEIDRNSFIEAVKRAGRDLDGHNRTKPGEPVTKDNVYFGEIDCLSTNSVARFERAKDDPHVQDSIRQQIIYFVLNYEPEFKLDWLR